MKTVLVAAFLTGLGGSEAQVPQDPFLKGFKENTARISMEAFQGLSDTRVRNRHYSIDLLQEEVQRRLSRERKVSSDPQALAAFPEDVRPMILKETHELLDELSHEVNRLAQESPSRQEFAWSLEKLGTQMNRWAKGQKLAPSGAVRSQTLPPTEDNIEGPFYRPNAPFTAQLAGPGQEGEPLTVSGRVLGTDGSPIPGALLDVWQADAKGDYDIADPNDRANPKIPFKLRGRMRADADGSFRFETILPGQYEIGGGRWRPKHIHVKVSSPRFQFLTTQLYFEGDRFNEVDPWWKPSLTMKPRRDAGDGSPWLATFEFVLKAR